MRQKRIGELGRAPAVKPRTLIRINEHGHIKKIKHMGERRVI